MNPDELAARVIEAIQGKPAAVTAISDALASGDVTRIRESIAKHANIHLSQVEAQQISDHVKSNPTSASAYVS